MNCYEIQITASIFIQAENQDDCEMYLKETIHESGLFNVVAKAKQVSKFSEYIGSNNVYTNYEVDWKA